MKQQLRLLMDASEEWTQPHVREMFRRRADQLRDIPKLELSAFRHMLRMVRNSRREIINAYAYPYRDRLKAVSSIGVTLNPHRLLRYAQTDGQQPILKRREFEALSFFDIAYMLTQIERYDNEETVANDMDAMVDLLVDRIFQGDRHIDIWTMHEPDDSYRVKRVLIDREPSQASYMFTRRHALLCRTTKGGVPVLFHHRAKDQFRVWLKAYKRYRNRKQNPFSFNDRAGLSFVAPTVEDVEVLKQKMAELIEREGGSYREVHSNMTGQERMDAGNAHSNEFFKACKCTVNRNGRVFELLFMTLQDYYSSQFALNLENHELYRLRQMCSVYLPKLFPEQVYGIDWGSEDVYGLLRTYMLRKLNLVFQPVL